MLLETSMSAASGTIEIVEYLFHRLQEVGVRSVHGLPGDFNLVALDYLPKYGLNWVGNVNELNAGYAADGYARVKGISAMITTYGVGELSAINAIAGAYAEYSPIIHIVGAPSTNVQKSKAILHHTLGNGEFHIFEEMNRPVSCAMALLDDPEVAASRIDDTIRQCLVQRRPVYISLPTDMVRRKISAAPLQTPIELQVAANEPQQQTEIVNEILQRLSVAKSPVLLVDACASRHHILKEVDSLVRVSSIPTFVSPMGKGTVDETLHNYKGIYCGTSSVPAEACDQVEQSDLVIQIGAIHGDLNTAGFTTKLAQNTTVELHSVFVRVGNQEYPAVHMKGVLEELANRYTEITTVYQKQPIDTNKPITTEANTSDEDDSALAVTHEWLWPQVSKYLQEDDILVTETGTSNFGIQGTSFPRGVTALNQMLWCSIGWSLSAAQGASLAARDMQEKDRRTVLFIGDGSFQLGCQEVSTMIRQKLNITIFVICNNGFTIERLIHGMQAEYNDIQTWNVSNLPFDFGATTESCSTYKIHTRQEWRNLVADAEFVAAKKLQIVELHMPWDDAPFALKKLSEREGKR